jgi:TonB family protein
MKQIIITSVLIVLFVTSTFSQTGTIKVVKPSKNSQEQPSQVTDIELEPILALVEKMPAFPGGDAEYRNFIRKNINYPSAERNSGKSGFSYVHFIVETDGTLSNIKILKGVPGCANCDREALRIVSNMPKWIPGEQNGRTVRVEIMLPIGFPTK